MDAGSAQALACGAWDQSSRRAEVSGLRRRESAREHGVVFTKGRAQCAFGRAAAMGHEHRAEHDPHDRVGVWGESLWDHVQCPDAARASFGATLQRASPRISEFDANVGGVVASRLANRVANRVVHGSQAGRVIGGEPPVRPKLAVPSGVAPDSPAVPTTGKLGKV